MFESEGGTDGEGRGGRRLGKGGVLGYGWGRSEAGVGLAHIVITEAKRG